MSPDQALAFVERHGIVLESTRRGTIRSLADAVAGEELRGNWWSHASGKRIFAATRAVRDAPDVLVCRLVDDKVTCVHARLWPALARLAERFAPARLARLREVHGANGTHRIEQVAYPDWLDDATRDEANALDEARASDALGAVMEMHR
jgi:hypothetical protein